jgi:uncharacterized protein (DUF427 family)
LEDCFFYFKAFCNNLVIAQPDDTIMIDGNHYFPAESLRRDFVEESDRTSRCFWKGTANYYTLRVDGKTNEDAVWYYPDPKPAASEIRGRIAFWNGVQVIQ